MSSLHSNNIVYRWIFVTLSHLNTATTLHFGKLDFSDYGSNPSWSLVYGLKVNESRLALLINTHLRLQQDPELHSFASGSLELKWRGSQPSWDKMGATNVSFRKDRRDGSRVCRIPFKISSYCLCKRYLLQLAKKLGLARWLKNNFDLYT